MTNPQKKLGGKPTTWAVMALVLAVGYGLLQPVVNSSLGWHLPSLTALLGQSTSAPHGDSSPPGDPRGGSSPAPAGRSDAEDSTSSEQLGTETQLVGTFGYLRQVGDSDFLSPAGLRYTRGSQEGHRLKHLARHLADQPDRPGSHGVFLADMPQVLKWVDEGYERAQQKAPGTSRHDEDGRVVYEAEFAEPIGFVGGRSGASRDHPPANKLRLVTEGNRVITAFPF
jgi:hypothetical protein